MIPIKSSVHTKEKKATSNQYHLSVDNKKERNCHDFFMKTLDIGRKTIDYTIKEKRHGTFSGKDKRGSKPSAKKNSDNSFIIILKCFQGLNHTIP